MSDFTFNDLGLPEKLLQALRKMQFSTPTPIQEQAVPIALDGRDVLGSAQTGTGKTAAFGIPLVAHLLNNPDSCALVMTPTRELANQVLQTLKALCDHERSMNCALLIGGENMFRQFEQLERNPRIIVGTPGRINDHLERKSLRLDRTDFLVLDETDRMLDMGFTAQIDKIIAYMPQQRQTLLFSATMPKNIVSMAGKYMNSPVRIAVGSSSTPAKSIKQDSIYVSQPEKYDTLTRQLDARGGSIIVFVRTKHGADRVAGKLERENHSAAAIHGDLRQRSRDRVIRMFRDKKIRILVATDVAARGLDVPHVEHVINFDLPQCPEDFIHRIGRTARAGASGEALSLIAPDERGKWIAIERLLKGGESVQDNGGRKPSRQGDSRRKTESGDGFRSKSRFSDKKQGGQWQDRKSDESKSGGAGSGERKFGEKKFGERKSGGAGSGERKFGEKKFGERKFGEAGSGERKFGEKKFGERKFGEAGSGERKFGEKKFGERKFGEAGSGERKFGEKKFGERKSGGAGSGERKFGEKKFGEKKFGEKKFGEKKFSGKSDGGKAPFKSDNRSDGQQKKPFRKSESGTFSGKPVARHKDGQIKKSGKQRSEPRQYK